MRPLPRSVAPSCPPHTTASTPPPCSYPKSCRVSSLIRELGGGCHSELGVGGKNGDGDC